MVTYKSNNNTDWRNLDFGVQVYCKAKYKRGSKKV